MSLTRCGRLGGAEGRRVLGRPLQGGEQPFRGEIGGALPGVCGSGAREYWGTGRGETPENGERAAMGHSLGPIGGVCELFRGRGGYHQTGPGSPSGVGRGEADWLSVRWAGVPVGCPDWGAARGGPRRLTPSRVSPGS